MTLPLRVRVLTKPQKWSSANTVVGKSADDIPALRRRLTPPRSGPGTLLTGKVPKSVAVDWLQAELPGRSLRVRRYRPRQQAADPRPVLVDFHGGGFVIGDPTLKEWFNAQLAARLDAVVVSVDYRLAPEHPFPAAYEDAVDAARWASATAQEWCGDPARMVLIGDSAGANLATGVALADRDACSGPRWCAQVLLYPPVDLAGDYPSAVEHAVTPMLTSAESDAYLAHYLGDLDRSDPRISPLLAVGHRGLPPAVIIAAEHDPHRDQGPAYAEVLRAAGVPVRQTTYTGAAHGFLSVPGLFPVSLHALTEVVDALRRLLPDASPPGLGPKGA